MMRLSIMLAVLLVGGAAIAQTTQQPPPAATQPPATGSGSAPMGPPSSATQTNPSTPGSSTVPGNPNETQRKLDTPTQGGSGGGGGSSGGGSSDTTAPAAASGLQISPDGSILTGNAEPGATVGVDTNGDGQPDVSVVAGPDGSFQVPLEPPLTNGETISVVVTDPAGNSSPPVTVVAPDFPDAPQVNASNGSEISGTAEAGVTIVISDGNGNPIGQTTADANGNWSYTPDSQLPDGTVVNVVAQDAAGNSSPPASTTIDGVAPAAPVIDPSNGTTISGTAEPGSTVTLTDGSGNPTGQPQPAENGIVQRAPGGGTCSGPRGRGLRPPARAAG